MSEPKFTKGPWKSYYEGSGDFCVVAGDKELEVGTCWSKDSHFMGLGPKSKENEANANLICAAPEMFEALTWICKWIEQLPISEDEIGDKIAEINAVRARVLGDGE